MKLTINKNMSFSNDTYNRITRIMDRYVRGHTLKDNVVISATREDMKNLVCNIELAECQKGKDIVKEEISEIIKQVEKNNNPEDRKYWENLYCELRNAIVRIDIEL